MLNFVGIVIEDLKNLDNVVLYARAHDLFIRACAQRIQALRAHKELTNITHDDAYNKLINLLSELENNSKKMHKHYLKVKEHILKLSKLNATPFNVDAEITEQQADELLNFVLPILPDIGLRRVLDEDGLLMYTTHSTLQDITGGNTYEAAGLARLVAANKELFNPYDEKDAATWIKSVQDIYSAANRKSLQNAKDHLRVLRMFALQIEHTENDAYVSGLQVAYLLDLYLVVNNLPNNSTMENFKNTLGSELAGAIDVLLEAPDPNAIANQNSVPVRAKCCVPWFNCIQSKCTQAKSTQRELQLRNIVSRTSNAKITRCCGL